MPSNIDRFRALFHGFIALFVGIAASLLAGLLYLNLACNFYFDPYGSTVPLRFSFGWPMQYKGGFVPGSGQFTSALAPNYVWGHPEYNNDQRTMRDIESHVHRALLELLGECGNMRPSTCRPLCSTL
jgi:hypothetical protein